MDSQDRVQELLDLISSDEKYNGCVFRGPGIYFVVGNGSLWEISDDASCSPRGGWFPDIVSGPSKKEMACMKQMMESYGFDMYFFSDIMWEVGYYDHEDFVEHYKENEDRESLTIYRKIKRRIDGGKTPFGDVEDFIETLKRYDFEEGHLYYEWEGEYIDLHDNICDAGESRGTYESMSDEEWIELLEHIDDHIVRG